MPPDGFITTPDATIPAQANGWAILNGTATYTRGAHSIVIGGGASSHGYARELRGGEPPAGGSYTLYCTGSTPMEQTFTFEARTTTPRPPLDPTISP